MIRLLGIGNALTDVLISIESDDLLQELGLPKGSMQLIDQNQFDHIHARVAGLPKHLVCGGSAANTVTGASRLGVDSAFIGKIHNDEVGFNYKRDLHSYGVHGYLMNGYEASGQSLVFVSPDGERTFATYLGAAANLMPDEIKPEFFQNSSLFYVEGYLVQNHSLILQAVRMAKEEGLKVALDLASFNVVEQNLDFLKDIITSYVDYVFANEEEAKALTGMPPDEALESIAKHVEIAIVKIGKYGVMAQCGEERIHVPAVEANCIDTTGAGDLFASGFIYGLFSGKSLAECARYGTITAGKTIESIGSKMSNADWNAVLSSF
jgi:sugar/nucleoside kinase (ribokinase family)